MVSEDAGDNCIVIVPGANDALTFNDLDKASSLFETSKVLICQLETSLDVTLEALKRFKGISILNGAPAIENLDIEFLKNASMFCVNETEATTYTGLPCTNVS